MNELELKNMFEEKREELLTRMKTVIRNKEDYDKVYDKIKNTSMEYQDKKIKCLGRAYTTQNKIQFFSTTNGNKQKEIVVHEFMHIIANVFYKKSVNHSKQYKRLGQAFGYPVDWFKATTYIERTTQENNYKYRIVCQDCGATTYYKKKTNAVKQLMNGEKYLYFHCGRCDRKNFKLEILR